MRLSHEPEAQAFGRELSAWLDANYPPPEARLPKPASSADLVGWIRDWQRALFDNGYLVPGWPPELGGRSASPAEQMIYFEELARRDIRRTGNPQGLGIIAPSLLDYGTDDQREWFLLPTLRAEISWCLGMSEPNAGSDLAALSTRAVDAGDSFVVTGQKIWTSGAHDADWCLCFVRTDRDAPRHKGISALIVAMNAPGVECRPFPHLGGPDTLDFNSVFFTDVRVPKEHLLGERNDGWKLTQSSLGHERAMLWIEYAYAQHRIVDNLVALAEAPSLHGGLLRDDPGFRDAVASAYVDAQALLAMGYRGFTKTTRGRAAPEHSVLKLFGSEAIQRAFLTGTEALATAAIDQSGPHISYGATDRSWPMQYLISFNGTIPGGTSEIQRNIIAERVLGLPRK